MFPFHKVMRKNPCPSLLSCSVIMSAHTCTDVLNELFSSCLMHPFIKKISGSHPLLVQRKTFCVVVLLVLELQLGNLIALSSSSVMFLFVGFFFIICQNLHFLVYV